MIRELDQLADFIIVQQSKNLELPLWTFHKDQVEEIINATMDEKRVYAFLISMSIVEGIVFILRQLSTGEVSRIGFVSSILLVTILGNVY
ncbi:MAG: hypothetical protein GY718_09320, partial [Lentisphaerae bacterium]|nr:hypothetical protein [Lentisphaerota bacterium]